MLEELRLTKVATARHNSILNIGNLMDSHGAASWTTIPYFSLKHNAMDWSFGHNWDLWFTDVTDELNVPRSASQMVQPHATPTGSDTRIAIPTQTQAPSPSLDVQTSSPPSMLDLLRDRNIIILCICETAIGLTFAGIEPAFSLFLQVEFGCSPTATGLMFLLIIVPFSIVGVFTGTLSDRCNKIHMLGYGMVGFSLATLPLAFVNSHHTIYTFSFFMVVFATAASFPMAPVLPLMSSFIAAKGGNSCAQGITSPSFC